MGRRVYIPFRGRSTVSPTLLPQFLFKIQTGRNRRGKTTTFPMSPSFLWKFEREEIEERRTTAFPPTLISFKNSNGKKSDRRDDGAEDWCRPEIASSISEVWRDTWRGTGYSPSATISQETLIFIRFIALLIWSLLSISLNLLSPFRSSLDNP